MRRVMTLYAVNAWLPLSGAAMALGVAPQEASTTQLGSAAAAAYEAENWSESAKLYGQMVQTAPNPRAWYRLGVSFNKSGKQEQAMEAFEKGRAQGLPRKK
jgi:TolA-binding protein